MPENGDVGGFEVLVRHCVDDRVQGGVEVTCKRVHYARVAIRSF